jgi:murein DD-endopeptidase MepM/ murein hydrolase activator NlpD
MLRHSRIFSSLYLLSSLFLLSACLTTAQNPDLVRVKEFGASAGYGSGGVHRVVDNEDALTPIIIAQTYQVPLEDLIQKNNVTSAYRFSAGSEIALPPPQTYTVQMGDNILTIAKMFDLSPDQIRAANHLISNHNLQLGQVLILPRMAQLNTPPETRAPVQQQEIVFQPPVKPNSGGQEYTQRGFIKPVNGKIISQFGPKKDGRHNDGINIRAPLGSNVLSAETGEVVYAGNDIEAYGNLVLIRHDNNYVTTYAHLQDIYVKKGDKISKGQKIGSVGSTGRVDEPQLHFEIRKGKTPVNPKTYWTSI